MTDLFSAAPVAAVQFQYLTSAEVHELADMLAELREITRSRKTYVGATAFLRKVGRDVGDVSVSPAQSGS